MTIKRIFDVIAASTALIVLAPLIIVAAALVKVDSPGPALFRQDRVGLHGRPFTMLKLRSMVRDAEMRGGHATVLGDARVTRVGRWIRRTSIDELPQLINVLRGDMSIVGPRPNVPAQRSEYDADDWAKRNQVRPGLTGLAQVSGRSQATVEERRRADLQYVDEYGLALDLQICLRTILQLAGRRAT